MPNKIPIIIQPGYNLDPKHIQRIRDFIDTIPTKVRPTSVTVVDPDKFPEVVKAFNNPDKTDVAFTIGGGRIYLNGAVFSPTMQQMQKFSQQLGTKQLGYIPEHALAHEISHLNDTKETGRQQESHDGTFNNDATTLVNQWASKAGRAYQAEQSRIDSDQRKIQPTPASVNTTFENPMSSRVQNIMAQQPSRSYVQRVIAQQPASSLRMADRMKLQSPKTGK